MPHPFDKAIGGIKLSLIKIDHVSYVYGERTPFEKTAVNDVSLEIEKGEFVGVIGHTGSGKSTLIQHINGLLRPTSGTVYVDGQDVWEDKKNLRQLRFDVGLVFQYPEYQLFEETVYKDIAFGPKNMGLSEDEVNRRVHEAAGFVGLREDHLKKSPFELSGGQKRRAAIAGVIAMEPKVLILDEPTAGLDPKGRDRILAQIKQYHETTGNTILLVSHSMEDVAKFATNILVMNQAEIYKYDTVGNVFSEAEKIESMGLSIPQITRVFTALRHKGFDVKDNVYTVADGAAQLLSVLKGNSVD